ncbi:Major Facilitator Superfamily [Teratosphaeria destructans]|uniref:Major Facilitator Superfamily n=1 Tax=Teratosphaeria destructans TaxID=418781 RepID=A0A9W7T048_9PEZI|nr:Major Facilitator Superfamily [Teratosphaeria destructans]
MDPTHYRHGDFSGRSAAVLVVTIVMITISTLFVFFRILSRALIVKRLAIDDYLMLLAWVIACGMAGAICFGTAWGLGRHEANVPLAWQPTLRKANYVFTVLYQPALLTLKTSILAFYLNFSTTHRTFRWACIATMIVVLSGGFALTMVTIFQCDPVSATFQVITPPNAKCTDIVTLYLSSAPLNLITDFALLFLPMPILTGIRLPRKQKIILIVTFSFGIFVAAVDVVRLAYLQSAAETRLTEIASLQNTGNGITRTQESTDFSWYASFSFLWSVVEVNVGIMCGCVPGLKPLVSRFMPHLLRDPGDPLSKFGSISEPTATAQMAVAHRVPSVPEDTHDHQDVRRRDFGSQSYPPDEVPMGMMDFLTTPDMTELPVHLQRTNTAATNSSRHTRPEAPTFFDFVENDSKKSMVSLTNRESIFPISAVTILFFIWGFEYGLLDVLNAQFQRVAHMTPGQSTGIHSAYYAGYLVGPLTSGRLVLKHWGFKACYSVGLSIFACGTLIYWPAAVLTSFPAFIITNFFVGFGLSNLEIAANPFVALCGPAEYMEIRLNLSQGIQAIGSVVAPLIANRAFFEKSLDAPSLVNTQWAYLGIALATIFLAVAYYYVPLPEATDEELEDAAERMDGANKGKIDNVGIIWITLGCAVFSLFCYVGGQEVNATGFNDYIESIDASANPSNYMAIAHTAFAIGRFLAAGLGFWIKPRILLLGFYIGLIVVQSLAAAYGGGTGIAMLTLAFFFEGPIFNLIFAQALRGMGRHTKIASVYLTAAISGGAVFSPISSHITSSDGRARYALVVAVATFAFGALFALELNLSGTARRQVEPIRDATSPSSSRPGSPSSTASRALSFLHVGKRSRSESSNVECKERSSTEPDRPDLPQLAHTHD